MDFYGFRRYVFNTLRNEANVIVTNIQSLVAFPLTPYDLEWLWMAWMVIIRYSIMICLWVIISYLLISFIHFSFILIQTARPINSRQKQWHTRKPSYRWQTRATRKPDKNCSNATCLQRCRWQYWPILIHSLSCCCVRNLRNPTKFTENSNLW